MFNRNLLQPQQFFHASKVDLTPGVDQILPANDEQVGGSNYGYSHYDIGASTGHLHDDEEYDSTEWADEPDRGDYTFASSNEAEAEAWTGHLPGGGRSTTYVVDPGDDYVEEDQYMKGDGVHAKKRGPMDIIDRIDIPKPRSRQEHVQGTLPPVDWGRYDLDDDYSAQVLGEVRGPNHVRHRPDLTRHREGIIEKNSASMGDMLRRMREQEWKRAGQQEMFPDV